MAEQPTSVLAQVRKQLMNSREEQVALEEGGMVRAMWEQRQALKLEMNEAKKKAAEEAAQPYLEMLEKIEKRYAMYMKLSGGA